MNKKKKHKKVKITRLKHPCINVEGQKKKKKLGSLANLTTIDIRLKQSHEKNTGKKARKPFLNKSYKNMIKS